MFSQRLSELDVSERIKIIEIIKENVSSPSDFIVRKGKHACIRFDKLPDNVQTMISKYVDDRTVNKSI